MPRCSSRALLLALCSLTVFDPAEGLQTTVRPNKGSTVSVSAVLPSDQCAVCTVSGVNDTQTSCHTSLSLAPDEEVKLLFNCSTAIEQAFTVTVTQPIVCTTDKCSPTVGETQPSVLPELPRTFIWDLKAPEKTVVGLDVLGEGLVETSQTGPCSDGFQYSVSTTKSTGQVQTQAYCPGGSVTHLDLPNEATVSLKVQPKAQVIPVLFQASAGPLKGRTMVVTVDADTTVILSRDPTGAECQVCLVGGAVPNCSPTSGTLPKAQTTTLEFSCPKPQDVYSVTMEKKIGCTQSSCTPATGEADPNLFKEFKRSLTWDISVPERTVLALDFPGVGLKEIFGVDKCQDSHQYSLSTTNGEGKVKTKKYCKSGPASRLELLGQTTVAAEVPKDGDVGPTAFTANASPRKGKIMFVTPDPDTNIMIDRDAVEPDCSVCVDKAQKKICNPRHVTLRDALNTSVDFTCAQPQDYYKVEINREIDCTETSCAGDIVQPESSLFPDFNRTFTWDLKVPPTRVFQLDFPEAGMRQIPNGESCPDEHTYSVITYLRTGPAVIGTFCRGGSVTTVQALYKGRMLLQVAGNRKLEPLDIKVSVGPETTMVATVKVNLPRGVSDTDFTSASYPNHFPDNQQMAWDFVVPGMHNYTVLFRDHVAPECLKKEVQVEYHKEDKKVTKATLTDPQPAHQQGNFNMLLSNCETNRTLQGLSLRFTVSVMRSGHPVLCTVDLKAQDGVSVQIEKVGSDPHCEMTLNSDLKKKINVATGTKAKLSFLDCPNEDVRLTASKVIGCQNLNSCSVVDTQLTVPKLVSCLPMPLHSFTWHLNIPEDGTVGLELPVGRLRQSMPGQECNDSLSLRVAKGDGSALGDFCDGGIIQKVEIRSNASVTATAQDFITSSGPFLNVSFTKEISESIIYRVSPTESSVGLLATPNWPKGMNPFSTVSWIVTVPSQYQAALQFVNVSQPKCDKGHTQIKVQTLGAEEEILSRREDEEPQCELVVPYSFDLSMSNCLPQEGDFGAVTKVVLQRNKNLLAIIIGIVCALLLLLLIVLAVACVLIKKKKKARSDASIYMGKGNIFLPGDAHFSKTRTDNESHVYASIEDTMIYGHMLDGQEGSDGVQDGYKGIQMDSYQTFTGPREGPLPVMEEPESNPRTAFLDPSESFMPARPRTPIDRQDSLGFQDRRMVDNELFTFKSTGDMNTIRLSAADIEPEPPIYMITEEL
ncbi:CUB domain-containing protein 1 [Genypterus blacodes]|uniref:CUB domain-containing protein 1 n=1 Tax=Genypterus blacodes TaxID=154954 RepID=UPI003F76E8BA